MDGGDFVYKPSLRSFCGTMANVLQNVQERLGMTCALLRLVKALVVMNGVPRVSEHNLSTKLFILMAHPCATWKGPTRNCKFDKL